MFTKNILYAAFSLVIVFFSLAGIYVMTGAPFVAVTQILVYIGGIIVFIVFGIMLTNKLNNQNVMSEAHNRLFGYGVGLLLLIGYVMTIAQIDFDFLSTNGMDAPAHDVRAIGVLLMTDYLIPFEIAGVLLLIALIGATVIAGHKPKEIV